MCVCIYILHIAGDKVYKYRMYIYIYYILYKIGLFFSIGTSDASFIFFFSLEQKSKKDTESSPKRTDLRIHVQRIEKRTIALE